MPRSSILDPSGTERSAVTRISSSCSARRSGRKATRSARSRPLRSESSAAVAASVNVFSGRKIVQRWRRCAGTCDEIPGFHGPNGAAVDSAIGVVPWDRNPPCIIGGRFPGVERGAEAPMTPFPRNDANAWSTRSEGNYAAAKRSRRASRSWASPLGGNFRRRHPHGKVQPRKRRRVVEQRRLLGGGECVGAQRERGIGERAPLRARVGRQSRTMGGGKARGGVGDRIDDRKSVV